MEMKLHRLTKLVITTIRKNKCLSKFSKRVDSAVFKHHLFVFLKVGSFFSGTALKQFILDFSSSHYILTPARTHFYTDNPLTPSSGYAVNGDTFICEVKREICSSKDSFKYCCNRAMGAKIRTHVNSTNVLFLARKER